MKKLLSICILSVLLMMMSFTTAHAQSANQCCFWVENMQPVTFPHIANLDGTGIAQDTSAGTPLVLNNVLNQARVGNTDVYTLHFPTGADCGTKVSIEWLLYRDGQLVNSNMSSYADFGIYTRYDQLNANGECQSINWMGGIVENGDGICGCDPAGGHVGHNDFPGARQADPLTPAYFDETHHAAGYTHVLYTYNFDYFYLPFLASTHSTTNVIIKWNRVGNYKLIIRLRERQGGSDYDYTMDGSQNDTMRIGGHNSCCGDILYADTLEYLVTTAHEKSICDNNVPFMYGRGRETATGQTLYAFSDESLYYVLFGDYVCDHWKVEYIDTLQFYTRINPNIVAQDTALCRDEHFAAAALYDLVTEVDLDAPGILDHEIQWSQNGVAWSADTAELTQLNNMTTIAGEYVFYVRQRNFYYDAMEDATINCPGAPDTIKITVRDQFPPVLDSAHEFVYCNEELQDSTLVLTAHIDTPLDQCSTEIRWYKQDDLGMPTHNAQFRVATGDTLSLDLAEVNPTNIDNVFTYYLYTVNTNTETFSARYDSVVFTFHMTPVFTVEQTQLDFVVCPGAEVNLLSNVTCTEPDYNDSLPTVTYGWYLGDTTLLSNDTNYTFNASTVCNDTNTYTLRVSATSWQYGCTNTMSRTYTVISQDIETPVLAWIDSVGVFDANGNKLDTLSGCDSSAVPAPYTLANFKQAAVAPTSITGTDTVGTIVDGCTNVDSLNVVDVVTSHTACQTIVTRTYKVFDACGNESNTINHIFTLNNDYKPVITGIVDINPLRDTSCTYNMPAYTALRERFLADTNIHVTYTCEESEFATVMFYMNNTDVVADGNLNIFADTDLVTVYAVVTDTCGNSSVKTPVFNVHKPAPMYIANGSITLDTLELCVDVTTNMHFNDNYVMNADRPYTYQWSQISAEGQSVITPDADNYLEAVVSPENPNINTSSQFIMTVTDSLGCVAADTSNAVHFYMLPTAEIISHPNNTGNPISSGDTLCPNYGDFYMMVGPNTSSNLPDSVYHYQSVGFLWSGAADSYGNHTGNTEFFKMACENCDSLYTTYLKVTNQKNCSTTATFNIYGVIRSLPVITAIDSITLPLVSGNPNCVISIPDFVSTNTYFNPLTVQDECFSLSEMHFEQDIPAGTLVNHDTTVVVTIKAPYNASNPSGISCWTVQHNIEVKMPANTIRITGIAAGNPGCEPLDATLTPTVENASGAIEYAWSTGDHTATTDVTMTYTAHTYTLTVTDNAGCSNSMTVTPTVYRVPLATDFAFISTPNTHCDNNYDGTFTLQVLNDSTSEITGFTYNGVDYTLPDIVTGLDSGRYAFTVFTSHNCASNFGDSIVGLDTSDVEFAAVRWTSNFMCEAPYSGAVQVTPQIENYIYTIESDHHVTEGETQTGLANVITPLTFHYLYQDTYRVRVLNNRGCHFVTNDVMVDNATDTPTTHVVTIDTADCTLDNGILYIANTYPAYTYTVDGVTAHGNNGTLMFTGLSVGDHPITIVSSGNCEFVQPFTMPSRTAVPAIPTLAIDSNDYCTHMFGGTHGQNGAVTIPANQVMTGYTYTLAGTTITGVAGTAVVFDSLADNSYILTIKDDHNCGIDTAIVVPHSIMVFDTVRVTYTNGSDCANPDNKIQITNPNNEYNYFLARWDSSIWYVDTVNDNFAAHNFIIDSLPDGYYMIIQEHKIFECFYATNYQYLETVKPEYHITATHENDADCSVLGTGSITITNPNPNYTYSLAGVDTTVFTGLNGSATGVTYTIYAFNNVTNCNYDTTITIGLNTYTPVIDTVTSTPNFYCTTEKNGTITVTLDSLVDGVYHLWNDSADEIATGNTGQFTGLNHGNYNVYFESALHCESDLKAIVVLDSAFFRTQFVTTDDYTCDPTLNLPGTGCIYVQEPQVDAQHPNYTYTLIREGYVENNDIDRPSYKWCALAAADNYHVVIADTVTGCFYDEVVVVNKGETHVTLSVVKEDNSICTGTGNGSLTVTATSDHLDAVLVYSIDGGTTWYPSGTTVNNLASGNYEIKVKDTWSNCLFDTCSNREVVINTVKKQLTVAITPTNNTACEDALFNGSIVVNSVKYADGTDVNYTATIKHADDSEVDYATTITGGWGHLNGLVYHVNIHDNTTGCDSLLEVSLQTENVCTPSISITALNHNHHVGAPANTYYFCYGETDGQLVAEATSSCPGTFSYTWTSVCAHSNSNTNTVDVYTAETFCCKYYVTARNTSNGCTTTDSVTVCVDELPTIQFYATGDNIAYTGANPTVTYTNCSNYEFTLGVVNTAPVFDSIIWSNGYVDTNRASFTIPANTYISAADTMVSYCVWVMDQNGCSAGYTAANVITRPVRTFAKDTSSCGTFDYVSHRTGYMYHYDYIAGGTNTYTVVDTFYAANVCDSIVTYTVTLNATPSLDVPATTSTLLNEVYCHGVTLPSTFTVTVANQDAYGYCITNVTPTTFEADKTSFMTSTPFDPTAELTRAMNGKYIFAYAYNSCDTLIRNIGVVLVDSLPTVNGVTATSTRFCKDAACPGTELSADVASWNCVSGTTPQTTKWLVSGSNTDFSAATEITAFGTADSGRYVTYAATNHCGTTYATPVMVHVDSVAAPELALSSTTFCAGAAIELTQIQITHIATSTPQDTSYTLGGAAYTLGTPLTLADDGKQFVTKVTYECGTPTASNAVTITVKDTAHLVAPTTPDTLCLAGGPQTYAATLHATNVLTAETSDATVATVSVTGDNFTVTPVAVGSVTITLTSTAEDCGTKTESVNFVIADTAVVPTPNDVTACAGGNLTLTTPAYTANGNVYSEGWKLDGVAFDPTTYVATVADSGKALTYYVVNRCGTTTSQAATLHVQDTAHLELTHAIASDDTLCIGTTATIYNILVHPTNTLNYSVNPAGAVTFNKTGDEKVASGATLTLTASAVGNVTVTITSTGECGTEKAVSIPFVVSNLATVADITAPAAVCEGEVLALTAATITDYGNSNIHAQGWELKKSTDPDFAAFNPTTPMTADHNLAQLRYKVENVCGTVYSNVVNITVNDTAKLSAPIEANQTVCNHTAITNIVMTTNKDLVLSTELTGAGLSVSGNTISGTVAIAASETFPYILKGTVSTQSTDCSAYDKTDTIKITVNEKPTADLTADNDTLCAGQTFAALNPVLTTHQNSTATATETYLMKKKTDAGFTAFNIADAVDATMDSALVCVKVENGCGENYSDTVVVRVAGTVTIDITPVTFRDTCDGLTLADFIVSGTPAVTKTTPATKIVKEAWYKKVGANYEELTNSSVISNPTTLCYGVTTGCGAPVYSAEKVLDFDAAPAFVGAPFTDDNFKVCEEALFTEPTLTAGTDFTPVTPAVTKTWTLDGDVMDFATAYDRATYNGKEIKLTLSNACGTAEATAHVTIYALPVPQMLSDTDVCGTGIENFTLKVPDAVGTSSYTWYNADGTVAGTGSTVTLSAGTTDAVYKFYVKETDANGCVSKTALNRSSDWIDADSITVRVTAKPFFVFTNMSGDETHHISSSINNATTAYNWTLSNKCYSSSSLKIYVNFSIYRNGVLIPDAEIGNYIQTSSTQIGSVTHTWNTNQAVSFLSGDASTTLNDMAFYTSAAGNHYPHSNFVNGTYEFDWMYLPFITSRNVTNTVSKFVETGDYEIHYELYSANGSQINYYYNNGAAMPIGGNGFTTVELLASDVFYIHVDDGPAYTEVEAPEVPETDVIADEPSVRVYPNPASQNVNVRIEGLEGHTVVKVTTLTGKTVAETAANLDVRSSNVQTLNVSELTPGVYVIQIVNDEAVISRKLVITK